MSIMVLKYGPRHNNLSINMMDDDSLMELEPFLLFINSIRSNQTRQKYQSRSTTFFDFIALPDGILDRMKHKSKCLLHLKIIITFLHELQLYFYSLSNFYII